MALLDILNFPDTRLRTVAKSVKQVDDSVRSSIDDMFETMYAAPGIGLAATQVNWHKRIIVIDLSEEKNQPLVLINPMILERSGSQDGEEGCLSVPGYYESVERAEFVRIEALNRDGEQYELEAEGLLAVCIQHEIDHLNGMLFVDHISRLKRSRIQKKLEKAQKVSV
ncbi:MAG: peptide deformylase [Gammaproteobacteria bacterium]|nr:peptide deformylase [Gammaproteobacteria bacterium]